MRLARAGHGRGVGDGALLDLGDAGWNAEHDTRMAHVPRTVVSASDEVLDHLLGVFEVGDHTVAQRTHRDDVSRGAAEHPTRLCADAQDLARTLAHRDHRRFVQHDAAPAHVHKRVGGAEVDSDIGRPDPQHGGEQVQGAW